MTYSSYRPQTRRMTLLMTPSDKRTISQKAKREKRLMTRRIARAKNIYSEYKKRKRKDPIIDEVSGSIKESILSEKVQGIIRQRSIGVCTRHAPGTTSCRHLQMLFLLYGLANCIATNTGQSEKVRSILSHLWHAAIEYDPLLKRFYSYNDTTAINDRIQLNATHGSLFDGRCVFPMGLIKSRNDCLHIFHYFILLKEDNEYFIYNANGSDYLRAHPKKIKITIDEFMAFIDAVNTKDKPELVKLFILTYFMEGASIPRYFDEGDSKTKFLTIPKGKCLELALYDDFDVYYFPGLHSQLIQAAASHYMTYTSRLDLNPPSFSNHEIVAKIEACKIQVLKDECSPYKSQENPYPAAYAAEPIDMHDEYEDQREEDEDQDEEDEDDVDEDEVEDTELEGENKGGNIRRKIKTKTKKLRKKHKSKRIRLKWMSSAMSKCIRK